MLLWLYSHKEDALQDLELVDPKMNSSFRCAINNKGNRTYEYVKELKKIWTEENVEFNGEYYNIPQSKIGQNRYKNHTDLLS